MTITRTKISVYKIGEELAGKSSELQELANKMNKFEEYNKDNLSGVGLTLKATNDPNELQFMIETQWKEIILNAKSNSPWNMPEEISNALYKFTKDKISKIVEEL